MVGRLFAIVFMLLSFLTAAYALSSVIQTLVQSEIVATFGERRRSREMNKLSDHIIICGAGRVGSRIVGEVERAGVPFVVVESNAQKIASLVEHGTRVVTGDATLETTLRDAGVERARGLAACLPNDADNLYVVLTARDLNRDLRIVARAIEEQAEPKLIRAGASHVVSPTIIGSQRMAQALTKPAVAELIDSIAAENLGLCFEEVEVSSTSRYADCLLRATNIHSELDILIVALRRAGGEMVFNPPSDDVLRAGDMLIAIGRPDSLRRLQAIARGEQNTQQTTVRNTLNRRTQ